MLTNSCHNTTHILLEQFTDDFSDGGHFGRHMGPGMDNVDQNLIHVILNGLCPLVEGQKVG